MTNDIKNLKDLNIDDMFYISAFARVVRVVSKGRETLPTGTVETVTVKSTVPHLPIEGLVTEKQAAQNKLALIGSESHTIDEDFDDREWNETWAERSRPKLINHEGQAARLADHRNPENMILEVYCIKDSRKNARIKRCSRFIGAPIEGVEIDYIDIFRGDIGEAIEEVEEVEECEEAELDYDTMKYPELKKYIVENGLEVDTGKGACAKMREKLNGLCL